VIGFFLRESQRLLSGRRWRTAQAGVSGQTRRSVCISRESISISMEPLGLSRFEALPTHPVVSSARRQSARQS
jgi:hypothetical protein